MSILKKPVDFEVLENVLDNALKADELYKLQNDAKIRAIEQKVPTYDHFRNMVLTAHLKPLERSELHKKAEVSWNHCYAENEELIFKTHERSHLSTSESKRNNGKVYDDNLKLRTGAEFLKAWRSLTDFSQKLQLIYKYRKSLKDRFFKIEVPWELLEEFLTLSLKICTLDTVFNIIDILDIFSGCNRFSISLAMLSASVKPSVQLLFEKLLSLVQQEEISRVERLRQSYFKSL